MRDFDLEYLVSVLAKMVSIPSVNPFRGPLRDGTGEEAMASFYGMEMEKLGMVVQSSEVSSGRRNVWGRIAGSGEGPTVMLVGHMDTVGVVGYDNPFEPVIRNGRLYGRGSCDMKAGLAAYLETVRTLIQSGNLKGDIIVAGVVDEEHAMTGSFAFGRNGPEADFAIVGEPTDLEVACAHKGQINSTIRTFGKAVHSSIPELGDNAIMRMNRVLNQLKAYAEMLSRKPQHAFCGRPRFNVGVIRGGSNVSSVPDFCEVEIDRRTVPDETAETYYAELRSLLDEEALGADTSQVELLQPSFQVPPLDIPADSRLIQVLLSASRDVRGVDTKPFAFPGSTDAPNLGCPAVVCGPGAIAQCHSLDEYVEIEQVIQAARIYSVAVRQLWKN